MNPTYKIIAKDNLYRDHIADELVADNIQSMELGNKMVKSLNKSQPDDCPWFYILATSEYKLKTVEYYPTYT